MSPFLAILAFQAATVDPVTDPAFAKPITLHLPFTSVRDLAAALSKITGQPVDASGVLNDLKATVLVKELPAGRVMEAVADTLGLVWKKDGSYYRLSRPDGAVAAEAAFLQDEAKEIEKSPTVASPGAFSSPGFSPATGIPSRLPGRGGVRNPGGGLPNLPASRFDRYLLAVETANGQPPSRLVAPQPIGDSEYAKALRAWPSVPETVDPLWSRPVPPAMPTNSQWENKSFNLAETLAAWHDVTGLPVVADAFRISMRENMITTGAAVNVLQAYAANQGVSFKLANGVARMRHPAFWRLRTQEIPESVWSGFDRGKPTLDSLAAFAARLTPPQAAAFRSLEAPLSRMTTQGIREAYPALLLWNTLPAPARKALYAGTPVGLSAVQKAANAYAFALREAPFYNAGNPTQALATNPAQLGIFGTAGDKSFELRLAGERINGVSYEVSLP